MEEQLTFEFGTYIEDTGGYFEAGDLVQIKEVLPEMEADMSPEDYYYLLGYAKKKGIVTEIKGENVTNIYVDFGGNIGVFYEKDLKKII